MSPVASHAGRPAMGTGDGARSSYAGIPIPAHVPEPNAAFSFVPFYVVDDGDGTFSVLSKVAPFAAFNLESYANITVNKTYYVATTGSDTSGTGAVDAPFRTITKAVGMADVDKIYIAAGHYYFQQSTMNWNPTRSMKLIGVGDVYITGGLNAFIGTFSKVDSHYEASYTSAAPIAAVLDKSIIDGNGNFTKYTLKASIAEVDAAAGSYFYDTAADKVYVRATDDRAPDADIFYLYGTSFLTLTGTNVTLYFENLNILTGGVTSVAGTGNKLYIKDCLFDCVAGGNAIGLSLGSGEAILQNTTITRSGDDGIRGGGNVVQIDCTIHHAGVGSTAGNASSCHAGYPIIVNGHYSYSLGRPIHDIGLGKAWYLGVHAHHAGTSTYPNFMVGGLGSDYFETWCDQCVSSDSDVDFAATLPAKIHKHSCTGGASDSGDGVDTYSY